MRTPIKVERTGSQDVLRYGLTLLVVMLALGVESDAAEEIVSPSGEPMVDVYAAMREPAAPTGVRPWLTQQLRRNLAVCYDDVPLCVQLSTQTIKSARESGDMTVVAIARMQRAAANLRRFGFDICRVDYEQAMLFPLSPDDRELFLLFQIARTMVEQPVYRGTDSLSQLEHAIASAQETADTDLLELGRFELTIGMRQSWKHPRATEATHWKLATESSGPDLRMIDRAQLRNFMQGLNLTSEQTTETELHEAEVVALSDRLQRSGASRRILAEAHFLAASVFEHRAQHEPAIHALSEARRLLQEAGDLSRLAETDVQIAVLEHRFGADANAENALASAANMIELINQPSVLTHLVQTGSQIPDFARRRFPDGARLSTLVQARLLHLQNDGRWLRDIGRSSKLLHQQAMLHQTESAGAVLTTERDTALESREFYLRLTGIGLLVSCGLAAFLLRERWKLRKLNQRLRGEIDAREHASRERERMELHLAQSARLDSLGDLAGGIAHDFNNLLVGVLGNAELLRYSCQVSGNATEYLDGISHSAERAAELSRKMLAYAGKQPAQKSTVELNRVVQLMLPLFRHGTGVRNDVEFIPSPYPVYTEADEGQLEQILLNLVTNSSHAMRHEMGKIAIRVGVETLDAVSSDPLLFGHRKSGGEFVWFEVSDGGDGIPGSDLARVFEPFYTTKPKETSHGFGLAVVYGHVNRHDGLIRLTSGRGLGTTFRILLPRKSEFHAVPLRSSTPPGSYAVPKTLSIVIVDDQVQGLQVVEGILKANGWTARCFTTVSDALEFLSEEPAVHCLVIDLMMPGLDGTSMLEVLEQRGVEIPVVLMSGYSSADIDGLNRFSTVASFLQKPFRPEQLQQAIIAAVDPAAVPLE